MHQSVPKSSTLPVEACTIHAIYQAPRWQNRRMQYSTLCTNWLFDNTVEEANSPEYSAALKQQGLLSWLYYRPCHHILTVNQENSVAFVFHHQEKEAGGSLAFPESSKTHSHGCCQSERINDYLQETNTSWGLFKIIFIVKALWLCDSNFRWASLWLVILEILLFGTMCSLLCLCTSQRSPVSEECV